MPKTRSSRHKPSSPSDDATHATEPAAEVPTISAEAVLTTGGPPGVDMARGHQLVKEFSGIIERTVLSRGDQKHATYAKKMEQYFRFKFHFYGINAGERRSFQAEWNSKYSDELKNRNTLLSVLYCLWEEEKREMQSFGCDLAQENRVILRGETEEEVKEAISCIKHLLTNKSWWDTVDALSYQVVGYLVKMSPEWTLPVMDKWIEDDNIWLRRSAILHQLQFKEKTDSERLFRYCLSRAHDKEFFIMKAIGWALRQYARCNPEAVRHFVKENEKRLSRLSIKEAMKHIHS